ncbi:SDR family NAD(P)-dependent oxidoreductase [Psychrobacter raelei]|uniref:SDR family NAD(P)-dependent oxidoreductase n=1 Tax=Psychrobacter raelei TaxID=2565531 RepID=UPI003F5FF41B
MSTRILITGATSGMGYQLAVDYLQAGHVVYAAGRNQQALNKLGRLGAVSICVDLTDYHQVMQVFGDIDALDIVICCAGVCHYIDITPDTSVSEPSGCNFGFDGQKIMHTINTNLSTLVFTLEAVLPALTKAQGRVVALGSASAYVPFARAEGYGSSKAAIHYLMQTLQISLKPLGVNVSLAIPGFVETPMTDHNNFIMPFLQTPKQASLAIRQGIKNHQQIIAFPKQLTVPLKTLGILPNSVWQFVSSKLYANR